jgi:dynein heavy chain 2
MPNILYSVLPILFPVIRKDLFRQGPRWVVQIGDKAIDYNDDFRLYLVTRNSQIDLPADAAALVTEVNFTVTRSGLEGQLLGLTLNYEKPELEAKKSALLAEEDSLKIQLADLEKGLLQALSVGERDFVSFFCHATFRNVPRSPTANTHLTMNEFTKMQQNTLSRARATFWRTRR